MCMNTPRKWKTSLCLGNTALPMYCLNTWEILHNSPTPASLQRSSWLQGKSLIFDEKEKSCFISLTNFYHVMTGLANEETAVDITYLDFRKTFDTFSCKILIEMRESSSYWYIPGCQYWVQSHLTSSLMFWMMGQSTFSASELMTENREKWFIHLRVMSWGSCCFPEGPQQAGEIDWQEPHEV